ncbi:MAG: family 43 glycosylhydrolase [Bacteroidota bacterium]
MRKSPWIWILVFSLGWLVSCKKSDKPRPDEPDDTGKYRNPVAAYSLPDPTIIRAEDGSFYLFATEDIKNVPIHQSDDLVAWRYIGTAFTNGSRPVFEPNGGLWAPDINFINNQYVLFYSMSVWGGEWTCGIGVATSDKPEGPYTDRGKLFRSNEIGVQNSIDPFYIEEGGKKYLFWGSFRGIYAIELSDDGLSLRTGAEKQRIAGTAYEGVYIYKKNEYYYMFASTGSCCEGVNSTYTTVAGRSDKLMGPYLNKNGLSMSNNQHEVLIRGNDRFVGTGHNSEIITDKEGKTWVLYHAVDKTNPNGRVLMLDEIQWANGWPYVQDNTSSRTWKKPVF